MKRIQQGFTLIELVVVIVILGILAATALPKFINMAGDAADAGAQGVAGALSSASAINYAKVQISSAAINNGNAYSVSHTTTCATIAGATGSTTGILAGGLPSGYQIQGTPGVGCTAGASDQVCQIKSTNGNAVTWWSATLTCTG